jgi:hypothetical protein
VCSDCVAGEAARLLAVAECFISNTLDTTQALPRVTRTSGRVRFVCPVPHACSALPVKPKSASPCVCESGFVSGSTGQATCAPCEVCLATAACVLDPQPTPAAVSERLLRERHGAQLLRGVPHRSLLDSRHGGGHFLRRCRVYRVPHRLPEPFDGARPLVRRARSATFMKRHLASAGTKRLRAVLERPLHERLGNHHVRGLCGR